MSRSKRYNDGAKGCIHAEYYNDQQEYLYELSFEGLPSRYQGEAINSTDPS